MRVTPGHTSLRVIPDVIPEVHNSRVVKERAPFRVVCTYIRMVKRKSTSVLDSSAIIKDFVKALASDNRHHPYLRGVRRSLFASLPLS